MKKLENIIKTERNERKIEQESMKNKIKKLEEINKEIIEKDKKMKLYQKRKI